MEPINNRQLEFTRGAITMALGEKEFVEMAVDMALSYKLFNTEPVSCIVDLETKKIIDDNYRSIFDKLLILPDNYNSGRLRKFSCAELTPYNSTVFIDSDIIFLNNIDHLWQEGERNNNVTMIGHYIDKYSTIIHHGYKISELLLFSQTKKYLKTNSGFFHFSKPAALPFFKACEIKYNQLLLNPTIYSKGWLGDEIAIGIVGETYKVSCFNTQYSMLWDENLAVLKKNDNNIPICHYIAPIPTSTVNWQVRRAKKLRKENNIEIGGEKVWIALNNKRIMSCKPNLKLRIIHKLKKYFTFFYNSKAFL